MVVEEAIEGAIEAIVDVVPAPLGRVGHRDHHDKRALRLGDEESPRFGDDADAWRREELLQRLIDVCGVVYESCLARLVPTWEATTDVQQPKLVAHACRFVEDKAGAFQCLPEGPGLRASTAYMETQAHDVCVQIAGPVEQVPARFHRGAELVRQWALRGGIVGLNSEHQLGRGVMAAQLAQLFGVVEDQPPHTQILRVLQRRDLPARIGVNNVLRRVCPEVCHKIHFRRARAIETTFTIELLHLPEGLQDCRERVALDSVERLDAGKVLMPEMRPSLQGADVQKRCGIVLGNLHIRGLQEKFGRGNWNWFSADRSEDGNVGDAFRHHRLLSHPCSTNVLNAASGPTQRCLRMTARRRVHS
mmetsp:Transcript_114227/g.322984  ORF Transcript_114227/g.322984 Transcript_114227/m.322984 type:complete len:361 (+) Transcript_114227:366-1448(+)